MAKAQVGDTVNVNYTGKLDDGTVFDTSEGCEPLQFTIGEQQVIPGFEEAVVGMEPGETKTVVIPSDQAYGPHREDLVATFDREQLPADLPVNEGEQLQLTFQDGSMAVVMVTNVKDGQVTLDGNHPLAGADLTFELQLVSIAA